MSTLVFFACAQAVDQEDSRPSAITWHQDVAPLVAQHCSSCHSKNNIGSFLQFSDYSTAKILANLLAEKVQSKEMPPFLAGQTEDCQPKHSWKDDPRLSAQEIALFVDWAANGAPEGDATNPAPLPNPTTKHLSEPYTVLTPDNAFTTPSEQGIEDEFICFVLDPELNQTQWIQALEVIPDNTKVVHHVVLFLDNQAQSESLKNDQGWYTCFGGSGTGSTEIIAAWAPGTPVIEYPENAGLEIPQGSRLIMQMHYHPVDTAQTDQTQLHIQWSQTEPSNETMVVLRGNNGSLGSDGLGLQAGENDNGEAEFRIPANAAAHKETMRIEVEGGPNKSYQLFMLGHHMHYFGTDMRVYVERNTVKDNEDADECLLQTPKWDYNWQLMYFFDADNNNAPIVRGGDILRLECIYNNTMDNPDAVKALTEQSLTAPIDVGLGEGTLDEMCLAAIGLTIIEE
ncbi:MAG: hypothetical protein QGI45_07715 [Myxococcota bacterium]|nr:hypothetical protein [Myxococcota bacterium]